MRDEVESVCQSHIVVRQQYKTYVSASDSVMKQIQQREAARDGQDEILLLPAALPAQIGNDDLHGKEMADVGFNDETDIVFFQLLSPIGAEQLLDTYRDGDQEGYMTRLRSSLRSLIPSLRLWISTWRSNE